MQTTSVSEFFDFEKAQPHLDTLIGKWSGEISKTATRRKVRDIDVDIAQLQRSGKLKPDETFIPIRVVNTNIEREQPAIIKYLTGSWRLIVLKDLQNPSANLQTLEEQITQGLTYQAWEIPFIRVNDGAATHGWDHIEVEFDVGKPYHVGFSHIGHENLLFPPDIKDIQAAERIMRRYELTVLQLKTFVGRYGFSEKAIGELLEEQVKSEDPKNIEVYKVYFKVDGVVWVAWYSPKATAWLKNPEKLYLGRNKGQMMPGSVDPMTGQAMPPRMSFTEREDETLYPIKTLFYRETEETAVTDKKGRVWLDEAKQEVQTALWSSYVNGAVRASNIYSSPKASVDLGVPLKPLDLYLEPGRVYNQGLDFWSPPYPAPDMLKAAQLLDAKNQEETGNIAFAVTSRRDSRKTATEINEASEQQAELTSVQTMLFSIFMQDVLTHAWLIIQSQAIQGLIPLGGGPQDERLYRTYIVKPAGDVDVVKRAQKAQLRKAMWPIVAQTPLALPFLIDIIREDLPEDAARYEQVLGVQSKKNELLQGMLNYVKESMVDDDGNPNPDVTPEKARYAQALEQQVQQVITNPIAGGM